MAPVAVLLSLLTNCVFCSNADWTYGYSSTERTSMPASGTPESQWCARSPSPTRLRVQIVTCPADTGSNLCLIAANRTPCRRHPRTRLQSHPHGLLLPQQSTHPCRSSSQCNRTCSYKPTATAYASECSTPPYRGPQQLTQAARPEPLLNISMINLVPVQRIERYRRFSHCWHKLPFLNLCRTFHLNQQFLLEELHACKPASMLSS